MIAMQQESKVAALKLLTVLFFSSTCWPKNLTLDAFEAKIVNSEARAGAWGASREVHSQILPSNKLFPQPSPHEKPLVSWHSESCQVCNHDCYDSHFFVSCSLKFHFYSTFHMQGQEKK